MESAATVLTRSATNADGTAADVSRIGFTPDELHTDEARVAGRIQQLREIAAARLGINIAAPTFDLRLRGLAAGKADPSRWHLRFNPVLLSENRDHFLQHTVGHEVAHLAVFSIAGRRVKPHGPEWRAVMSAFGLPARATHRYDVSSVPRVRAPYVYRCRCEDDIFFGSVRHARVRRGVRYFCRRCRSVLEFVRFSR